MATGFLLSLFFFTPPLGEVTLHLPAMKQRLRFGCAVSSETMFIDGSMFLSIPFLAFYLTFYFYSLSQSHAGRYLLLLLCMDAMEEGKIVGPNGDYERDVFVMAHSGWIRMSPANCFWTIFKQRKGKHVTSNGEQVHVTTGKSTGFPNGKSEDLAATRIQNAFRAFTARKDVNNSKVPERCQDLIQGGMVTKQVLSFIHSWSRMQQEIRARRLCMVTEYRVKQKKLENQLKLEAKIHELEESTIDFPP
ncbi:unnamed protein product [Citrullus colocynthis]|uniref:Uncharacterized protein n=1 Tax=Citrullus colocynthis TaxID=252529 RepID=A0ABP0YUV5_9ROSI